VLTICQIPCRVDLYSRFFNFTWVFVAFWVFLPVFLSCVSLESATYVAT
jgi:hypothetical protein